MRAKWNWKFSAFFRGLNDSSNQQWIGELSYQHLNVDKQFLPNILFFAFCSQTKRNFASSTEIFREQKEENK